MARPGPKKRNSQWKKSLPAQDVLCFKTFKDCKTWKSCDWGMCNSGGKITILSHHNIIILFSYSSWPVAVFKSISAGIMICRTGLLLLTDCQRGEDSYENKLTNPLGKSRLHTHKNIGKYLAIIDIFLLFLVGTCWWSTLIWIIIRFHHGVHFWVQTIFNKLLCHIVFLKLNFFLFHSAVLWLFSFLAN